jgi:ABC-type transport system involved in multi-copper enzyme maturation permease subunit
MRPVNFVFGYVLPAFIMGIAQLVVCILCGYIASLVCGQTFFSFANVLLLMLSSLPNLIMCVFLGVLIGVVFNDKAASAITSVFISVSGILGGAWIPLDTMGGFETFCRFLPFYPSVYIGRVITGAQHTFGGVYEWNATATIGLITIFIYLAIAVVLSVLLFAKKSTCDNK